MSQSSQTFQREIKERLEEKFLKILKDAIPVDVLRLPYNKLLIKDERQMKIDQHVYSPRCDVAVGPFSFGDKNYNNMYLRLASLTEIDKFITSVKNESLTFTSNGNPLDCNNNPRCFIAIEVEKETTTDPKHVLGSITNSSLMGKFGIVIVYDDYLSSAQRLLRYINFVEKVKKVEQRLFRNVFVISESAMKSILQLNSK